MTSAATADRYARARRIVVKIGSVLLADPNTGAVRRAWLETLAADISAWHKDGHEILVVSSGAIAVGRTGKAGRRDSLRLEDKQAAAAIGQIRLAHAYQHALEPYDITVAQLLLTLSDTEDRRRYLNARNTINALLRMKAVPVINENDTVATNEIRFGDNDRLAARVAQMASADLLLLLGDIDGLYSADPHCSADARHIAEVDEITPAIEAMAGGSLSDVGSGGMVTKIAAAKIAVGAGCHMVIAEGGPPHPLARLAGGARCTWFIAHDSPVAARKQWIAGKLRPAGRVTIDDGAARALTRGKSLLPAGVTAVDGDFGRGDPVMLVAADGREIGRGLSAYGADAARRLMGHKTSEIERLLGYRGRDEMIHRDDLVLDPRAKGDKAT